MSQYNSHNIVSAGHAKLRKKAERKKKLLEMLRKLKAKLRKSKKKK